MDYVASEDAAKFKGVGIWAGRFVMPWEWRRGKRLASTADKVLGSCLIKGNIGRAGKRIFHVPGGRWYERTTIHEDKGERWFCTEEEAQTAGWRKSSQ
jgi:hypothetical protein